MDQRAAKIFYGVAFDEEAEFPWDTDEYDGDPELWWFGVQDFEPTVELFMLEGDWIDGEGVKAPQEKIDQYYRERREFKESHPPLPVERVAHSSHDWPMYILAVPGTVKWKLAGPGYPLVFEPSDLVVSQAERQALLEFCEAYGFEFEGEPGWFCVPRIGNWGMGIGNWGMVIGDWGLRLTEEYDDSA